MSLQFPDSLAREITQEITKELRNELEDELVETRKSRTLKAIKSVIVKSPLQLLFTFIVIINACFLMSSLSFLLLIDVDYGIKLSTLSIPDLIALKDKFLLWTINMACIVMTFYTGLYVLRSRKHIGQADIELGKKQEEVAKYVELTLEVIKRLEYKKAQQFDKK